MKNIILILFLSFTIPSFSQNEKLMMEVFKETLPQLLNDNPNSLASYVKGGGMYNLLANSTKYFPKVDGDPEVSDFMTELNFMSDSILKVLEENKIVVLLSDTLFSYKYSTSYTTSLDGWVDSSDLRTESVWQIQFDDLVEVFQTNYEFRGLSNPVSLDFIELIKAHIHSIPADDVPINLADLDNGHYVYQANTPANRDSTRNESLFMNAIRLYKPVFNKTMDKACYLFSYEARNGPWRVFVFVEKINGKWYFIESYGSEHIDRDDNWLAK